MFGEPLFSTCGFYAWGDIRNYSVTEKRLHNFQRAAAPEVLDG